MIDSGAEVDVLSEGDWEQLKECYERNSAALYDMETGSKKRILAYASDSPLQTLRTFCAWVVSENKEKPRCFTKFFVIAGGRKSLLSRRTAVRMKVLKLGLTIENIIAQAPETAGESIPFPSIPNEIADFDIDETIPPTKNAYYHVPAAYSKQASARLADMEAQDIIEKVERAPRWISGMSAVPKGKEDFRLVVNMKGPNKAIRRQFHLLPRMDEMKRKLHGARYFTKLDLKNAFFHIQLSDKSRELTTFMTEIGMYRFKRLVFGVNCAPEIFQRAMERILQGLTGVIVFIDDILVYAHSIEALREQTEAVLKALRENNLTLNSEKCEYDKERVKFLGHELSEKGMDIDQSKVETIAKFREPKTGSELRSFLGLATYVSPFIPRYSNMTTALWKAATSKAFEWNDELQGAFENTKKAVMDCTVTQGFFSDSDETILYTDASPYALGAVLVQVDGDGTSRIISFASKTLTPTEKRYAQTQREALAIVWAVEHFYYFLLGREFVIRTDAQGVAFIFRRDKQTSKRVMSRADGWALRLSAYSFKIEYVKGTFNIADPSSRLFEGAGEEPYVETGSAFEIGSIKLEVNGLVFEDGNMTIRSIKEFTQEDPELQQVRMAIVSGEWPKELYRFKAVSDELSEQDGILLKSGALILPKAMREAALALAHSGHPGETAMKTILRARLWWPGMSKQIEEWVKTCKSCTLTSRKNPPVPMKRSRLPDGVWDALAVDFNGPYARFGGIYIFVIVDCYSRYLMASRVKSTDFDSIKPVLEALINRNGRPQRIRSDNGPPYSGQEYKKFCEDRGIEAEFSTPLHPQQNGMVERYMQLVNKAMQIAVVEGKSFESELANAIRAHNSAKHRITQVAPEELMFARKLRHELPLAGSTEVHIDQEKLRNRDEIEKASAKQREDSKRSARDTKISVGDFVVVARAKRAKGDARYDPTPFKVIAKHYGDLELLSEDGCSLKRNVTLVKKLQQKQMTELEEGKEVVAPEECQDEVLGEPLPDQDLQLPQQKSKRRSKATEPLRRSSRITKAPTYMGAYIQMLNFSMPEDSEID